jgi:formylglycine-generating enzyme required for sulfatase activity
MKTAIVLLALWVGIASAAELPRNLTVNGAAERRVALVIGNAAYPGTAALKNPANDAKDIAAKLKALGFDVILRTDVRQKEMLRSLTEFGDKVLAGTEAIFFYAGHGMQVRGKNYLIPIDAEIRTEGSVSSEAVDVDQLLDKLALARMSMVILDACRNNPFERRFRGGGQGLAQINAPTGTLIAYATAPGKVAADGEGRNGLYTSELLAAMDIPGIKIEDVFKRVRGNVVRKSGDAQTPWESSSLTGDFYFIPGPATTAANPASPVVRVKIDAEIEQELWDSVRDANSIEAVNEYLKAYPRGRYVTQARVLGIKLKKERTPLKAGLDAGASLATDAENALWDAVEKSGGASDYAAYLGQYPKGRFAVLAELRHKRLKEQAELAMAEETRRHAEQAAEAERQNRGRYERLLAEGDESLNARNRKLALAKYEAALVLSPGSPELATRMEKARALAEAGEVFTDRLKDGSAGPEMVVLPAGKFQMGDVEGNSDSYTTVSVPVHEVTFRKPFAMGRFELTFEEFDRFCLATGRELIADHGWGRGRRPATKIVWDDAVAYVEWLSAQTGKRYRIPTEAEWEFAARAGTRTNYWWGDQPSHEYANYGSGQPGWFPVGVVEGRDQWEFTAPVGQFPPNPYGLYDMQGNVWEWVADCWHDTYAGAPTDGSARGGGDCGNRVMRGGSWGYNPKFMRASSRVKVFWGVLSFLYYGVRVGRDID